MLHSRASFVITADIRLTTILVSGSGCGPQRSGRTHTGASWLSLVNPNPRSMTGLPLPPPAIAGGRDKKSWLGEAVSRVRLPPLHVNVHWLAKTDLLVIDVWGSPPPGSRNDLIGEPTLADAICDELRV